MRVLLTGANGFIGQNLRVTLERRADVQLAALSHKATDEEIRDAVLEADFVFHLAGVNRPETEAEFTSGNVGFTERLCKALEIAQRSVPVLYTSSIQANLENAYGISKRGAEDRVREYGQATGAPVYIYQLPNVFGKWCRPNYNSAIATFCHNIARGLPITIHNPDAPLSLVYIDDVVEAFVQVLNARPQAAQAVEPVYATTVGAVAAQIQAFRDSRETLVSEAVGTGLVRALYATYLSYLPTEEFSYSVLAHADPRGVFVEMLKTRDSGQFSFFTARPGITRGGHYHHTKTEKFLVVKGQARFGFRHVVTGEAYELFTSGDEPKIVETVPGWSHDITNVGEDDMVVLLWASEIFDRSRPDTYTHAV